MQNKLLKEHIDKMFNAIDAGRFEKSVLWMAFHKNVTCDF